MTLLTLRTSLNLIKGEAFVTMQVIKIETQHVSKYQFTLRNDGICGKKTDCFCGKFNGNFRRVFELSVKKELSE